MLTVVLVEDHDALRLATGNILQDAGYRVLAGASVEEVEGRADHAAVDVYVLDLNLPGRDGADYAASIRHANPQVGIIMFTARATPADISRGYQQGADVYLTKPVAPEALVGAIEALGRRMYPLGVPRFDYVLDACQQTLSGPTGVVALKRTELALLAGFLKEPGQTLETWQVSEYLGQEELNKPSLEVQLVRLRKKLIEAGAQPKSLRAVRLSGYQLCLRIRFE
jgi:DNA-binding response OmpR family regulator